MKAMKCLAFGIACTAAYVAAFAVAVFAAPVLAATYQVETDKPEGVYRCGETATFTVTVLDTALRVEAARCSAMPVNIRWPGHQRELDQTEICSFARFDFNGSAEVCVTPRRRRRLGALHHHEGGRVFGRVRRSPPEPYALRRSAARLV